MNRKNKVIFCLSYLEIETTISLASQGGSVVVTSRPEIMSFFSENTDWPCIIFGKEDVYVRDVLHLQKKRELIYSVIDDLLEKIDEITLPSIDVYLSAPIAGEIVWCVIEKLNSRKKVTLHFSREFLIQSRFLKDISIFDIKKIFLCFLKKRIFCIPVIFKTNGQNLFTILDVESWNIERSDYSVFPVSGVAVKRFVENLHGLVGLKNVLLYLPPVASIGIDAEEELALFKRIYNFCTAREICVLIKEHPQYPSSIKDYQSQFPSVLIVDSRIPAKMILRISNGIISYSTYALAEGSHLGKCSISLICCIKATSPSLLNFKLYLDEKHSEKNPILYPNTTDQLVNIMEQRLL